MNRNFISLMKKNTVFLILVFMAPCLASADPIKEIVDPRDGMKYKVININNQRWLDKNSTFKTPNSSCPNGDMDTCMTFGRIYNWHEALMACPSGTHLPSDNEMFILEKNIEGKSQLLKSLDYGGLKSNIGFNAQPGGYRELNGKFMNFKKEATLWTSTEKNNDEAFKRWILTDGNHVDRIAHSKKLGYQVRCLLN